jgi:hypothetical protein
MDLEQFGKDILNQTIVSLKGEYAAVPYSVKAVMPKAALLIAASAIGGGLDAPRSQDLKHALAIMANVKVGGQIALSELMLETAANIISAGLNFVRKLIGI